MNELIQWPSAKYWTKAWNPVIGCHPCGAACDHCYARTLTHRFGQRFTPHLAAPGNPPRSGVVFCGNMTDLFGDWCDGVDIDCSIEYIAQTLGRSDKATYLWLTKRPANMCETLQTGHVLLKDADAVDGVDDFPLCDVELCNQFFGFTAWDQQSYDWQRSDFGNDFPKWANAWLSLEPLLGPIDLHGIKLFRWIVVGCESGPKRRPCRIEWVEDIVERCQGLGLPVFVKQLDIGGQCVTDISKFPQHLQIRQIPWLKGSNT